MIYSIEIDDSLVPACEAATENRCEKRNPDNSVWLTKYPKGFLDRLQELANIEADAILKMVIEQGPASLLPENIKADVQAHQEAQAAVSISAEAVTTARKAATGVVREVKVLNEPPKPVEQPSVEEVLPGDTLPVGKLPAEGLKP